MSKVILAILVGFLATSVVAVNCGRHCAQCAGPNTCTRCADGYAFGQNGACVCRVGHFDNGVNCPQCPAVCTSCSSATVCTSCTAGFFVNSVGTCQSCSTCGDGQFVATACSSNSNTVCGACDPSCVTCFGPNAGQCNSCGSNHFLDSGNCFACTICGGDAFETSPCTSSQDTGCQNCDASCLGCNGPSATQCTSCADLSYATSGAYHVIDFFLDNGSCIQCSNCASGTFDSSPCTVASDTVCSPCDSSCSVCTGPSPSPGCA